MNSSAPATTVSTHPYQRALDASTRIRWDIDRDVLRGRELSAEHAFLPDGLSLAHALPALGEADRRLFSQIQGRTYANMFGLVERYINAAVLELGRAHVLGDQVVLQALVRFSEEELKHQELFRRVEALAAQVMPPGYQFLPDPDAVAHVVLARSSWAVLALTCHIELFTLAHYRASIEPDPTLSPVWKDVFRYHWLEESQHALLDELEWRAADAPLSAAQRDAAVDDFLALVGAVDGILRAQAASDAAYFLRHQRGAAAAGPVEAAFLHAYRYQYIRSGVEQTRFAAILFSMITPAQRARVEAALATLA